MLSEKSGTRYKDRAGAIHSMSRNRDEHDALGIRLLSFRRRGEYVKLSSYQSTVAPVLLISSSLALTRANDPVYVRDYDEKRSSPEA